MMLAMLAAPALAQPAPRALPPARSPAAPEPARPRTQPVRDVVVTYQVEGQVLSLVPGGIAGPVRLSWDASGQRLRAEAEGRSQVALIDLRNHTGQAIDTTLRLSMPLPIRPQDLQPLTLDGARLLPRGKETIAGLVCTTYLVETGKGAPGSACLTADGVPLRGKGEVDGKPGSFVATSVTYGGLASGLFTVPNGYVSLGGASGGLAGLAGRLGGGGLPDLRSLGAGLMGRGGK